MFSHPRANVQVADNAQYQGHEMNGHEMNDLIAVEKIAQWQRLKTLVLDSVSSRLRSACTHGAGRIYLMASTVAAAGVHQERGEQAALAEIRSLRRKATPFAA
jgi:hypothetical protein